MLIHAFASQNHQMMRAIKVTPTRFTKIALMSMDCDKTYSAALPVIAIVFVGHYVYCVIAKALAYKDDSFALS
jgi:Na+/glutamate symporter